FMLGEWEMRDLHRAAFDATYAWSWAEAMTKIAKGQADVNALFIYYSWNESSYPRDAMRMIYTSNHDQNAWEGTEYERYGPAREAAAVLSVVGEGIPMIYNGQEAGNARRLQFFEKDPIVWKDDEQGELFKRLFALKHAHPALWNGAWGGRMYSVVNSAPGKVLSFFRRVEGDTVFAALNLSAEPQTATFVGAHHHGSYRDAFSGEAVTVDGATRFEMAPWSWRMLAT
ncbi:MAG: alpha-amlyase, partial [Brevundimonas sp.]